MIRAMIRPLFIVLLLGIAVIGVLSSAVLALAGVLMARGGYAAHDVRLLLEGVIMATAFVGTALLSALVPGRFGLAVLLRRDLMRGRRTDG
jgi:hypothetical protein